MTRVSKAGAEHTPGPWFAFDDEIVSERGDVHVAEVPLMDGANPTEWQANLRLIAAAPDLLAALKMLLANIEDYQRINHLGGSENHDQQLARAAIAKAEGR